MRRAAAPATRPVVAVSWTGGKDCHLALLRARRAGARVAALVVFRPPPPPVDAAAPAQAADSGPFRAHPLRCQRAQAAALGLPLHELVVDPATTDGDYLAAYANAIRELKLKHVPDLSAIVTGDIDLVGSSKTNFVTDACARADCGVRCWLPLWGGVRQQLLAEMLDHYHFEIAFSCVKSPHFDQTWVGRQLNRATLADMEQISHKTGLDLCGENGEYHTLVLRVPELHGETRLVLNPPDVEELTGRPGQKPGEQWWTLSPEADLKSTRVAPSEENTARLKQARTEV